MNNNIEWDGESIPFDEEEFKLWENTLSDGLDDEEFNWIDENELNKSQTKNLGFDTLNMIKLFEDDTNENKNL